MGARSAEGLIEAGQPAALPQAESHMEGIAGPKWRGLVEAQACGHGEISHLHRHHLQPCLPQLLKPLPGLRNVSRSNAPPAEPQAARTMRATGTPRRVISTASPCAAALISAEQ